KPAAIAFAMTGRKWEMYHGRASAAQANKVMIKDRARYRDLIHRYRNAGKTNTGKLTLSRSPRPHTTPKRMAVLGFSTPPDSTRMQIARATNAVRAYSTRNHR